MKERLPVNIENLELPVNEFKRNEVKVNTNNKSYGYVSVLQLLSLMITLGSLLTIIFIGK